MTCGDLICPLCRDSLEGERCGCDSCGTTFHHACFIEFSGCPTLGCPAYGVAPIRELRVVREEAQPAPLPPSREEREVQRLDGLIALLQRTRSKCTVCGEEELATSLQCCEGCGKHLHPDCLREEGCVDSRCQIRDALTEGARRSQQTVDLVVGAGLCLLGGVVVSAFLAPSALLFSIPASVAIVIWLAKR